MKPTQERLKELFDYREDGNLIRKTSVGPRGGVGDIAGSSTNGYVQTQVDGKRYLNHVLIWCWHKGYFPENGIDHKDRIRHHNWIDNLREVSQQCNIRNTGNFASNTSGVKGVSWAKSNSKWNVQICVNNKGKYLGYFEDFDEAVCHRLAAEQCLGWEGCDSCSPAYLYVKENILQQGPYDPILKKEDPTVKDTMGAYYNRVLLKKQQRKNIFKRR